MDTPSGATHTSGASLRAFDIAMIIIPTIFIVLRFWSRALPRKGTHTRKFWWDDWAILVALPINIAACSLQIYTVDLGMGEHKSTLTPAGLTKLHKVLWASYFMSDLGIMIPKASVLFFYARIFTTHSRWFRYGLWLAHVLNIAWWLSGIARDLLFCDPVNKYWDGAAVPGFCRSADALYIGSAVPSVIIDFFVLLLPLPIIARLSMKASRKAMITALFVCGYLVIAISLGRLVTSLKFGSALDEDLTYYGVTLIIFVAAEPAVSIIGCCLPVIFYLFQQIYVNGLGSVFFFLPRSGGGSFLFSSSLMPRRSNNDNNSYSNNKNKDFPSSSLGNDMKQKNKGYGRQQDSEVSSHSLENMVVRGPGKGGDEEAGTYYDDLDDSAAAFKTHDSRVQKKNQQQRQQAGLYDGDVSALPAVRYPQAAATGDGGVDVRSNRDTYERALAGTGNV